MDDSPQTNNVMRRMVLQSRSTDGPDLDVTSVVLVDPEMLVNADYRSSAATHARMARDELCQREREIDVSAVAWREIWTVFMDEETTT